MEDNVVTVTLDAVRLARARRAIQHVNRMLEADVDRPAFVADMAVATPLGLAAWLAGPGVRVVAESQAAEEAAKALMAAWPEREPQLKCRAIDHDPYFEPPVRVVPAPATRWVVAAWVHGVTRAREIVVDAHSESEALAAGIPLLVEDRDSFDGALAWQISEAAWSGRRDVVTIPGAARRWLIDVRGDGNRTLFREIVVAASEGAAIQEVVGGIEGRVRIRGVRARELDSPTAWHLVRQLPVARRDVPMTPPDDGLEDARERWARLELR